MATSSRLRTSRIKLASPRRWHELSVGYLDIESMMEASGRFPGAFVFPPRYFRSTTRASAVWLDAPDRRGRFAGGGGFRAHPPTPCGVVCSWLAAGGNQINTTNALVRPRQRCPARRSGV